MCLLVKMFICLIFTFMLIATCDGFVEYRNHDHEGPIIITDETRLHNDLFYMNRTSHPTSELLDVRFGMTLKSVVDYQASKEAILISAYIRQKWTNPVISWDPKYYGGITRINVRPDKTWTPDIYAYGDVEGRFKYNGLLNTLKTNIIVSYDGSHYWLAPIIMNLGCGMNIKDFPFDTQTCPLMFGSYTHDNSKVNLIAEDVVMKTYSESPQWIFKSMNHTRDDFIHPGTEIQFSNVKYTIIIKRKPVYYMLNQFAPTIILAFLTLLVFTQPITGERCVYLLTIFLSLNWYLTSAIEYLPSSSEGIPLTQKFLGITLGIIVLLSLLLCYSIGCHYGDTCGMKKMSPLMRKYVLGIVAPYFGIDIRREYSVWRENLKFIREAEVYNMVDRFSFDAVSEDEHYGEMYSQYGSNNDNAHHSSSEGLKGSLEELLGTQGFHQIHILLDIMLDKMEKDEDSEWHQQEWHLLARALDYLFIYFFTSILGFTLVYFSVYVMYIP